MKAKHTINSLIIHTEATLSLIVWFPFRPTTKQIHKLICNATSILLVTLALYAINTLLTVHLRPLLISILHLHLIKMHLKNLLLLIVLKSSLNCVLSVYLAHGIWLLGISLLILLHHLYSPIYLILFNSRLRKAYQVSKWVASIIIDLVF